ncbi:MAG: GtrA family protein [Clostridia bacterium]|nr:GtrA family protein [Clostridia bacterium]
MKSFFKKLIDKTIFDRTFWKFVLVGVVNTLVGLGVNYLLLFLLPKWGMERNVAFWVASAANYVVGSILSFFLNKYFTFKNDKKSFAQILRFIANIVVCWILAYGIAKPLVTLIFTKAWVFPWQNVAVPKHVDYVATLVGAGLFMIFNYFGQRFFAFNDSIGKGGETPDDKPSDDGSSNGSDAEA